jgi:fatty acid desaturase
MSYTTGRKLPSELIIDDALFLELRKRNYFKIVFHSLLNIVIFLLLGLLSIQVYIRHLWWIFPLLWLSQAFVLGSFMDIAHECIHNNFGSSSRINRIAGIFWLLPGLINFSLYKNYHLEHHKHTRVADDPEPSEDFSSFWEYLSGYILVFFYAPPLIMTIEAIFGKMPPFIRSEKLRHDIQADTFILAFWLVGMITLTLFFWQYAILMYWLPLLFFYPVAYATVTVEHYGCDMGSCLLSNTRTISSNFIFRCLAWNANYHAEHHVYPSVPAHSLPKLHSVIGGCFKYQEKSYILFHWQLIRNLLKR